MTPEEVAKRYAFSRSGYELAGYAEVGLPVYQLTIRAYTVTHKKISPLDEFTLKSINAGLSSIEEISNFLGLKNNIVRGVLTGLIMSDDVSLSGTPGNIQQALRLTQKGKHTLEEAEVTIPEERTFQIHFDGLLRHPSLLNEVLYAPREVRDNGWLEIPAIPSTPPQLQDLKIQDVEQIIRQIGRRAGENKRDILSIKSIEGRKRLFRQGVILKYKIKDDANTQIAFAIDGRLVEEYEKAFALGGGPKRTGLDKDAVSDIDNLARDIQQYTGRSLPLDEREETLKEEEASAALSVARAAEELIRAESPEGRRQAEEQLRDATLKLEASEAALAQLPVRFLSVYEHPPLLDKALTDANERLMIISPWIRSKVVNMYFLSKLEILLRKGVQVYIGYGIGDGKGDPKPTARLQELSERYPNLKFKNFGNTHAKLLLYDRVCVTLGSFNWLSFKGDPDSTFRDEQSFLVSIPEVIEGKFNEQVQNWL
jgi:hypothetical protein